MIMIHDDKKEKTFSVTMRLGWR